MAEEFFVPKLGQTVEEVIMVGWLVEDGAKVSQGEAVMEVETDKAVFPVDGMGSRFLPATKASPKEMMPIVDKPLIQYAVEEAVAAGITDMVFITGRNKRAIEDHFDKAYEMEAELELRGKNELLRLVQETVPAHINCIYIRQAEPLGLGHAVLCAAPVVGDEPFAVLLADDLIDAEPPVLRQMVDAFGEHESSLLGVQTVPFADTGAYGIVSVDPGANGAQQVTAIVEKPRLPRCSASVVSRSGRRKSPLSRTPCRGG